MMAALPWFRTKIRPWPIRQILSTGSNAGTHAVLRREGARPAILHVPIRSRRTKLSLRMMPAFEPRTMFRFAAQIVRTLPVEGAVFKNPGRGGGRWFGTAIVVSRQRRTWFNRRGAGWRPRFLGKNSAAEKQKTGCYSV
jgi:hypothetical protein